MSPNTYDSDVPEEIDVASKRDFLDIIVTTTHTPFLRTIFQTQNCWTMLIKLAPIF